jgi:D-3-phosphoglycerate dehydrogenase
MRLLIADGLSTEAISRLKQIPQLDILEYKDIARADLKEIIPTIDILIVRSRTQIDRQLLEGARNLKLAIRAGIGLDNVDVAAATEQGVVVMNAPTGNIVTTAEHALALLFAVSRHIARADASMREGKWDKKSFQGSEIRGKTLGVMGLGNIGKAVAERGIGLKMDVIGYDPYLSEEAALKFGVRLVSMDELLAKADYVTVHVPLLDATRNLISRDAFSKMKKTAYLINCARGGIVDETALIEALDKKLIKGAALDVFEQEPLPADHPLLKRTDVVLTPHLGASTEEAQYQVGLEVAEQVAQYVRNGALKNAINVPNVTREELEFLRPHLTLCEKLGSFAAQAINHQNVKRISVRYEALGSEIKREVLTLSVLQGFLSSLTGSPVNFVTARKTLKERGIGLEESVDESCTDYNSLVRLTIEGDTTLTVAGTLFGKTEARIVKVDDFCIDSTLSGTMLFTKNIDKPGVIGAMGNLLGRESINIARMHLGRSERKSSAIALISVDSELNPEMLGAMRDIPGMTSVVQVRL